MPAVRAPLWNCQCGCRDNWASRDRCRKCGKWHHTFRDALEAGGKAKGKGAGGKGGGQLGNGGGKGAGTVDARVKELEAQIARMRKSSPSHEGGDKDPGVDLAKLQQMHSEAMRAHKDENHVVVKYYADEIQKVRAERQDAKPQKLQLKEAEELLAKRTKACKAADDAIVEARRKLEKKQQDAEARKSEKEETEQQVLALRTNCLVQVGSGEERGCELVLEQIGSGWELDGEAKALFQQFFTKVKELKPKPVPVVAPVVAPPVVDRPAAGLGGEGAGAHGSAPPAAIPRRTDTDDDKDEEMGFDNLDDEEKKLLAAAMPEGKGDIEGVWKVVQSVKNKRKARPGPYSS